MPPERHPRLRLAPGTFAAYADERTKDVEWIRCCEVPTLYNRVNVTANKLTANF